jgi:hypothetical protein
VSRLNGFRWVAGGEDTWLMPLGHVTYMVTRTCHGITGRDLWVIAKRFSNGVIYTVGAHPEIKDAKILAHFDAISWNGISEPQE